MNFTVEQFNAAHDRVKAWSIWNKFTVNAAGCWIWHSAKGHNGYGVIGFGGVQKVAHRHVYELIVGAIGDGLELHHTCRTRACVNPYHLEQVTHLANMALNVCSVCGVAGHRRQTCGRR